MKRKQNKFVFIFLLVVMIFQLAVTTVVNAETTTIDQLVPNDYQKKQFKLNKDLLHDSSSTNKENIPEEQKDLTFEGEKTSRDDELKEDLFLSSVGDQNTIKTKAENLQLFTSTETSTRKQVEEDVSSSSTLSLTTFIWILVGICLFLLLIVMVVWGNSIVKQRTPRNT